MLNFLFFICLAVLSLGQFASIYRSGEANVYLFDIVVGIFAFIGSLYFLVQKKVFIPKFIFAFLPFTFIAFISLTSNGYSLGTLEMFTSAFYLVRWFLYLSAGVVVFNMLVAKKLTVEILVTGVLLSGVFVSVLGFVQLLILPDFEKLNPLLGWDPHKNRLASTFFDPNFVGGYLNLCLAIAFGFVSKKRKFVIFSMAIILSAIFLTFSRSTWAMTAIIILIFGIFKYRFLLVTALIVGLLTFFAIPRVQTRIAGVTDPADSAHFRLISWHNAWQIAQDNLFLGVGFNTFRYAQKNYGVFDIGETGGNAGAGTDSSFLLILATTGVFGFVAFVTAYFWPVVYALNKKPQFYLSTLAILLALFVQSQFINALFYPQILFLWMTSLALFSYFSFRT